MSLRMVKSSKELRVFHEAQNELENLRRKLCELDLTLNRVVVKNNQVFEDNKLLLEEVDRKK